MLLVDAAASVALAALAVILAPGLAVVGMIAVAVVIAWAVSVALTARRRRPQRLTDTRRRRR